MFTLAFKKKYIEFEPVPLR